MQGGPTTKQSPALHRKESIHGITKSICLELKSRTRATNANRFTRPARKEVDVMKFIVTTNRGETFECDGTVFGDSDEFIFNSRDGRRVIKANQIRAVVREDMWAQYCGAAFEADRLEHALPDPLPF